MHTKSHARGWRLLAAILITLAVPALATAAHWPGLGGDGGRSGNQTVSAGTPPVRALYSRAESRDQNVQTSILATAGAVGVQRSAYGTADGRVHLRVLESGAAVGPAGGLRIDDGAADADVFGPGPSAPAPASVGLADTSTPGRLGQLLALHNDDVEGPRGDISIAQIDEAPGTLVKQVPLEGTDGYSIRSSPVLSSAAAGGDRVLFFVAESGDQERLLRVPVADAASRSARFGVVTSTPDVDADPLASPTVVWLRDASGRPKAFVAVGSGAPGSVLKTFAASDLAAGPSSGDLGDEVRTATVPVQPDGSAPSPAGAVKTAPVIYVAARVGAGTVVHRLVQHGNTQALATAASSPALAGTPAPALATDVESLPAGASPGKVVVVTTGQNLYLLDGATLAQAAAFSSAALSPGTTGFSQTTGAVAKGFAYVTTDDGRQLVLKLTDAQPVAGEEFAENPVNGGARPAKSAFGQPSVSRSFVQFASQKGVFVYVTRCGNPVTGTEGADQIIGTVAGAEVLALGGNDRVTAAGSEDCVFGGPGDDELAGDAGNDRVSAEAGNDQVSGGAGDDAVSGNAGADVVRGGFGVDVVYGREDGDTLSGNPGADVVRGGSGDDRIFGREDADAVSGNSGNDRASAGSGDDKVFGRSGDDGVSGNTGNDRVSAGGGNDRAFGRSGDDGVSGNTGNDRVSAGGGNDHASAAPATTPSPVTPATTRWTAAPGATGSSAARATTGSTLATGSAMSSSAVRGSTSCGPIVKTSCAAASAPSGADGGCPARTERPWRGRSRDAPRRLATSLRPTHGAARQVPPRDTYGRTTRTAQGAWYAI